MENSFLTVFLVLAVLLFAFLTLPRRKRRTAKDLLFEKRVRPTMYAWADAGCEVGHEEVAEAERRARG